MTPQTKQGNEDRSHLPRVKSPWSATGWPGTGLEHHQAIVHLSQKLRVYTLSNVGDLVWVCSYIIDFYKYLEVKREGVKKKTEVILRLLLRQLLLNGKGRSTREQGLSIHHVV